VRINHRELVANVYTKVAFTPTLYPINPGLDCTFPWLSQVAPSFEFYRFHDFKVHYVPSCIVNTAGRVMIGIDYDVLDPAPYDKQAFGTYKGTVAGSYFDEMTMQADVKAMNFYPRHFTRPKGVANSDQKTYDCGNVVVASTDGSADDVLAGELYVSYIVELFTPQMERKESAEYTRDVEGSEFGSNQVFASDTVATSRSALPIKIDSNTNTATFTNAWQGLINVAAEAVAESGIGANHVIKNGGSIGTLLQQLDDGADKTMATYKGDFNLGDTLKIYNAAGNLDKIRAIFTEGATGAFTGLW